MNEDVELRRWTTAKDEIGSITTVMKFESPEYKAREKQRQFFSKRKLSIQRRNLTSFSLTTYALVLLSKLQDSIIQSLNMLDSSFYNTAKENS